MSDDDLRAFFTGRVDTIATLLQGLIAIESPTSDRAAVNRMGVRVRAELESLGAAITIHTREAVGDIIEAQWHIEAAGKPLLIVCHMDTVHPIGMLNTNPIRRKEGLLYGPGSIDMKGSIAVVLNVIEGLQGRGEFPARPLTVLMTSDEETGSQHSRELIMARAREAALAMIMEPASGHGVLKVWRKSVGDFTVRAYGIAAHAGGAHEAGLNAIEEMAHQIVKLQGMTDYEAGTTVSVGTITGGSTRNTVPDFCEVWIDARATNPAEMERVTQEIHALEAVLPGARIEVEGAFDRPPMERDAVMEATVAQAKAIAAGHGLTLRESGTGGASDGNYTAGIGTPTLDGLGPVGNGAHTAKEHVVISSLATSATLLAALLMEWPGGLT